MKTFRADPPAGGDVLLVFVDASGAPGGWLRLAGDVVERGGAADPLPQAGRTVLAVPGEEVAIHWLELDEGLTRAQAVAAARLMLADASAAPLSALHAAVGRPEGGLTPVALVGADRLSAWLAAAGAAGIDPDAIVPSPLLLAPPPAGFARRDRGDVCDYRGAAAAFTLEPALAGALVGDAPVEAIGEGRFEADLPPILAALPLDLRQGPFARRREWRLQGGRVRRIVGLGIALAALTLGVQVAAILGYTFAADRLEAEADALAAEAAGSRVRADFSAVAGLLFDGVRATPNVELSRLEYRPDGSLSATVMMDGPGTLAALQGRLEASGLRVTAGETRNAGGRPAADLTVRPA